MDVDVILFCVPVTDDPDAAVTATAYVVAGVMASAEVDSAHGLPLMVNAFAVPGLTMPPVRVNVNVVWGPTFANATLQPDTVPVLHAIFNNANAS